MLLPGRNAKNKFSSPSKRISVGAGHSSRRAAYLQMPLFTAGVHFGGILGLYEVIYDVDFVMRNARVFEKYLNRMGSKKPD